LNNSLLLTEIIIIDFKFKDFLQILNQFFLII